MNNIERKRTTMFKGCLDTAEGENIELENSAPLPLRNYRIYGNMVNALPNDYQQIEHITMSSVNNTYWINTQYVQKTSNFKVVGKVNPVEITNFLPIFGARTSFDTNQDLALIFKNDKTLLSRLGNGDINYNVFNVKAGTTYDFSIEQNGSTIATTLNGVTQTSTITQNGELSNKPQYLFAVNNNGNPDNTLGGRLRVYHLAFIENGSVVREFIPCKRKSDSKAGLYDLVTKQFFSNGANPTFSVGVVRNNIDCLSDSHKIGLGENKAIKLEISGSNFFDENLLKKDPTNSEYNEETGFWCSPIEGKGYYSNLLQNVAGSTYFDNLDINTRALYLPKGRYNITPYELEVPYASDAYKYFMFNKTNIVGGAEQRYVIRRTKSFIMENNGYMGFCNEGANQMFFTGIEILPVGAKTGKNLFNLNKSSFALMNTSATINSWQDGICDCKGNLARTNQTEGGYQDQGEIQVFFNVIPKSTKTYTLSMYVTLLEKMEPQLYNIYTYLKLCNGSDDIINKTYTYNEEFAVNNRARITWTFTAENDIDNLRFRLNSGRWLLEFNTLQIEEGEEATEYVPYYRPKFNSTIKEIDLENHEPLRKIGEKADYLDYKTQSIKRYIKCKEFDGTENWGHNIDATRNINRFSLNFTEFEDFPSVDYQDYANATSSHFVHGNTEIEDNTFGTTWSGLTVKFDQCETLADFKPWLAQQKANGTPFKIWYVLRNSDFEIEKKVLPTNIGVYNSGFNGYFIPLENLGMNTDSLDLYCSKLRKLGTGFSSFFSNGTPTENTNIVGFNSETLQQSTHLIFRVSDYNTDEQYRNWISSNQVTISYVTNTPKVEHIDLPEIPVCDFATKISCVGDLDCSKLEVEYYKN